MNFIEDRTAQETEIALVIFMPASSYNDEDESEVFNGRREFFWEVASEAGLVRSDTTDSMLEEGFSFWYIFNEYGPILSETSINEGIDKIHDYIREERPEVVLLMGMKVGLYMFGRGVQCGPLAVENDNTLYYLLPAPSSNPSYRRADILREYIRCFDWLRSL